MGDLSAHFSTREFTDRRTGHLVRPPAELLVVLENLRRLDGRPLPVISGHRCTSTNRLVGGATKSRHIAGDAADIPGGRFTLAQARQAGAVGVGTKQGFAVHVDVRPGAPATWAY